MKLRMIYHCQVPILDYASPTDRPYLEDLLKEQRVNPTFQLIAKRRRAKWAISVPAGMFVNDFREGIVSYDLDMAARNECMAKVKESYGYQSWRNDRSILNDAGTVLYHHDLLDLFRRNLENPVFTNTLYAFLTAATARPALIKGARAKKPFVPPGERHALLGHYARGPAWSDAEDLVLHQWFGPRTIGPHAGQHAPLTPDEWTSVLARLGNLRSVAAIRQRITVLNLRLARELSVNGYVPRDRLRPYMQRVLGERPRRPRLDAISQRRPPKRAVFQTPLKAATATSRPGTVVTAAHNTEDKSEPG